MRKKLRSTQPQTVSRTLLPTRIVAILLMLVGLGGFLLAQAVFDGSIFVMLLSTLITFAGLAWLFMQRRRHVGAEEVVSSDGFEEPRYEETKYTQPYERAADGQMAQKPGAHEASLGLASTLAQQVEDRFIRQGARVETVASRPDRTVYRLQLFTGEVVFALVIETAGTVDVNEARGLYAMLSGENGARGYLIAPGPFTQRAADWAGERSIWLVEAQELDGLVL